MRFLHFIRDCPRVRECRGVRLSIPANGVYLQIGPTTVEETLDVVNGDDRSVYALSQSVHCLPSPCSFDKPLTLDLAVRDGRVWWWERAAVREEVLGQHQVHRLWILAQSCMTYVAPYVLIHDDTGLMCAHRSV